MGRRHATRDDVSADRCVVKRLINGPVVTIAVVADGKSLDARQLGLNTHVMLDGCRGIELEPGDIGRALDEMKRAGAVLPKSSDL
jgi:hypothetical protein